MQSGIYQFKNTINGYVYVGQTQYLDKRRRSHLTLLRNNNHDNIYFQRAYNKYGEESFEYSILEHCSIEDLDFIEQGYLDLVFESGYTYNIARCAQSPMRGMKRPLQAVIDTANANRGRVRSDTQRSLMSANSKKYFAEAMSDPPRRDKILAKAKLASDKAAKVTIKAVTCLDTGETFESSKAAVVHFLGYICKKSEHNILACCRGQTNQAINKLWVFENIPPTEKQIEALKLDVKDRNYFFRYTGCLKNYRRIKCVELDKDFNSIKDAERFLRANGFPKATRAYINMCCLGHYNTVYGMHWHYINKET